MADDLPDWDDDERPTPPAFPDAMPSERAAGEHLRAVHDMFRRGLVTVGEIVDRVVGGDAGVGEARAAIHELGLAAAYQRLGSYCGQICSAVRTHHGIEDALLYPQLRDADEALAPALDRLTLEHEVIHAVLVRLDATLVQLTTDSSGVERLALEFRRLRRLLESHFDYEERAIGTALGVHRVMV